MRLLGTVAFLLFLSVLANAKEVTQQVAADVVRNLMESNGIPAGELMVYQPTKETILRRSASDEAPAYHLIYSADKQELFVVAGDDIAYPILGHATNMSIHSSCCLPPAMQEWLNDLAGDIEQARKAGVVQCAEVTEQWRRAGEGTDVVKLNTALWGQDAPFNQQCPNNGIVSHYLTGCVPTAFGIIMCYYQYPSAGRGVSPSYVCESGVQVAERDLNHAYKWDQMLSEYNYMSYTNDQASAVAQLLADIGAAVQANYGTNGTSAPLGHNALFKHFNFYPGDRVDKNGYSADDWNNLIKAELNQKRPVLYRGTDAPDNGGHAFVLEGYTDQNFFYVNWGWAGYCNGKFRLDAMNPDKSDYNSEQKAYLNFVPAENFPAVAKVGDIFCPSLRTALGLAEKDGTCTEITMLDDHEYTGSLTINEGEHIAIDLNGKTLKGADHGFFVNGELTFTDSQGTGKFTTPANTQLFYCKGMLTIEGGEFSNTATQSEGDTDYRRVIWADQTSTMLIKGGQFYCNNNVIYTKGALTIDDGLFMSYGNEAIVKNACTTVPMTINGGTFEHKNSETLSINQDKRRCLYTYQGTETTINGGSFTCNSTRETLCFIGSAIINGGKIENEDNQGIGCASNGTVVINDCKIAGKWNLYAWTGASLKCYGGLYSEMVNIKYLGENCRCTENMDLETCIEYPYLVERQSSGVETIMNDHRDVPSLEGKFVKDGKLIIRKHGDLYHIDGTREP